ncbi:hypothetical protein C0J52_23762 [Blattella germanica]|nr:hypothetical protein C0J52_23762 [Blattella germanica]
MAKTMETSQKGPKSGSFFPSIEQRLKLNIPIAPEITATLTAHGITKSYHQKFKIIDYPMCPCNLGEQTILVDHLIYDCKLLKCKL